MPVITTGLLMLQYAAQLAIWPIEEPLQDIVRRNVVDLEGLARDRSGMRAKTGELKALSPEDLS